MFRNAKKKKKKYSNLIREMNTIMFIDRGTTRSSYPELCLSDSTVSFSTLMSTAGLAMQGQEMPLWLEDQAHGYQLCCTKGTVSVIERWVSKKFVINDYWQHLTGLALCWPPQQRHFIRHSFSPTLLRGPLKPESSTRPPIFLTCVCLCMYVFKHTSHLEYFKMLDITLQMTFYKSNGISNIY